MIWARNKNDCRFRAIVRFQTYFPWNIWLEYLAWYLLLPLDNSLLPPCIQLFKKISPLKRVILKYWQICQFLQNLKNEAPSSGLLMKLFIVILYFTSSIKKIKIKIWLCEVVVFPKDKFFLLIFKIYVYFAGFQLRV